MLLSKKHSLVKLQPSKKELKNFGLLLSVLLIFFCYVVFPLLFKVKMGLVPLVIALVISGLSVTFTNGVKPVFVVWSIIGLILNYVNSRILLSFTYFFVFTPVAIYFKLTGRDLMGKKYDLKLKSYRQEIQPTIISDKSF